MSLLFFVILSTQYRGDCSDWCSWVYCLRPSNLPKSCWSEFWNVYQQAGTQSLLPPLQYCLTVQTLGSASRYAAFCCNTICMLTLNRNKIHIHSARFLRLAQISKLLIPLQYHRQCFALSNLASTTPCVKHFNNPFKLNWMFNEAEGAEMALCLPYGTGWCRYLP